MVGWDVIVGRAGSRIASIEFNADVAARSSVGVRFVQVTHPHMDVTACIDVFALAILLRRVRCDFSCWRQCCGIHNGQRLGRWLAFRAIAYDQFHRVFTDFGIRPIGSSASSVNGIVTIKVPLVGQRHAGWKGIPCIEVNGLACSNVCCRRIGKDGYNFICALIFISTKAASKSTNHHQHSKEGCFSHCAHDIACLSAI